MGHHEKGDRKMSQQHLEVALVFLGLVVFWYIGAFLMFRKENEDENWDKKKNKYLNDFYKGRNCKK